MNKSTVLARFGSILLSTAPILLPAALTGAILGGVAAPATAMAADANATRVTSSFEIGHTRAVLKKVEKLFSAGFTSKEAEQLTREIDHMKSDQPMSWTYNVTWQGSPRTLEVHALLDGLGMLDLDFVSAPDTTLAIRKAVDAYLNAH